MLKIQQQGFFISLWKAIMNTVVAWVRKVIVAKIVHYTEEKYGEPHMHNVFHSVHVINFNRTYYVSLSFLPNEQKQQHTYVEVLILCMPWSAKRNLILSLGLLSAMILTSYPIT